MKLLQNCCMRAGSIGDLICGIEVPILKFKFKEKRFMIGL